jgi:hypothetical protein
MERRPSLRILRGGPDLIQRATTQTLVCEVGDPMTGERPSISSGPGASPTFDLWDASGIQVVTAGSGSVLGAGRIGYSLASATIPATTTLGEGWREVWTFTISGTAYTVERDAAICRQVPTIQIVAEDLYVIDPSLDGAWPIRQAAEHWRPQIDEAARQIHQRLWEQGRRPWLIWSQGSPRQAALHLCLALCYGTVATRLGDSRWHEERQKHIDAYEREWDRIRFDIDTDDNGTRNRQESQPMIVSSAGPRWSLWRVR